MPFKVGQTQPWLYLHTSQTKELSYNKEQEVGWKIYCQRPAWKWMKLSCSKARLVAGGARSLLLKAVRLMQIHGCERQKYYWAWSQDEDPALRLIGYMLLLLGLCIMGQVEFFPSFSQRLSHYMEANFGHVSTLWNLQNKLGELPCSWEEVQSSDLAGKHQNWPIQKE